MQKSFGSLVMDLQGTTLQPEERELLAHPLVGGVILFTRNFESLQQLKALTQSIRAVKEKPLLIMVDQEGGRVQRFRQDFTRLPKASDYQGRAKNNLPLALQLAKTGAWLMASELLAAGVDLSLAPILDLNKGVSAVIGDRAFGSTPEEVKRLASAFIEGMKEAGMSATGKHFPGHGSVAPDSHLELPVDERSWEQIEQDDLQPFMHFIQDNISALMTAHIVFPQVDAMPVSFSRHWLQEILRHRLQFKGVVMSDDLDMKGADSMGDYADRMKAAFTAGCDIILLCNNRPAVIQVLDRLPYAAYLLERSKYELLRGKFTDEISLLAQSKLWQNRRDFLFEHTETV